MIILDSDVVRRLGLHDSSADLLRALRAVGERVAIPWMVEEELVAQRVIAHQESHDEAAAALKRHARHTPWKPDSHIEEPDTERVRKHWAAALGTLVETLPANSAALEAAFYREANALPPCGKLGKNKTGSRDAVIWLSAIAYAREHPEETVYFVSENTGDFYGDGRAYPPPMDKDVAELGDRFIHFTKLDEVIKRFTEETDTDEALAAEILGSQTLLREIERAAEKRLNSGEPFPCTTLGREVGQETESMPAGGWVTVTASLRSVHEVRAYRIGEQEWYAAVVRWCLSGLAYFNGEFSAGSGGSSWTTSVLFTPDVANPRVTVLRHDLPLALSPEEFTSLGLTNRVVSLAPLAEVLGDFFRRLEAVRTQANHGLPRAYEGALVRQARQSALERRLKAALADEDDDE
ncbi:PIN domain-containing protein [Streptomyces sp. NBC_01622]|uniref:PIN domain-containing protein n=1 Tax=Streptomyces sp. NBC_01622 TaxID=2975903 RepID=UPI00386C92BF|nr:PIN domain-containing protein [Streptomyces sp. NBC_01622]